MKNLLLFVMIFSASVLLSQVNSFEHAPNYYLDYQVIHFEECTGKIHVYANVKPRVFKNYDIRGHTFKAAINTKSSAAYINTNYKGDVEFYNVVPNNGKIDVYFQEYDANNQLVSESWIEHKVNIDNGMVRTTRKVDKLLVEFSDSKLLPNPPTLPEFFCNKKVSKIELLAFFKDYLDLTTTEMCQIIEKYDANIGNFYSPTTDYTWYSQLCTWFEEFLTGGNGGDPEVEESCKCKVIEVTSAAVNHTAIRSTCTNSLDDTNDCLDFSPLKFAKNYADNAGYGQHDNELQYSELRMGAAKGAAHLNFMDGGNLSRRPFTVGTRPAISELSYNLVCVNPNSLSVSLDSCDACTKHINFKYMYHSDMEAKARRAPNNIFNKHSAYINVNDFAILTLQNGANIEIDTGGWSLRIECLTNDNADTLNERAIREGADLVKDVIDFGKDLTGATIASTAELAIEVIKFAQENLLEAGCEGINGGQYETLLSDEKTITLLPGNKFTATLMSGTTFSSYTKTKGEAYGMVNSTFYMAGVLLSDQAALDAGYCECEKVGSYVIGTVEDFPARVPNDRDNEDEYDIDWENLYDNPSIPKSTLNSFVGTFLGVTGGDWDGEFNYACGGCDIVEIPCYADCVYVKGCENNTTSGLQTTSNNSEQIHSIVEKINIQNEELNLTGAKVTQQHNTTSTKIETKNLKIYPNPTNGIINLSIEGDFHEGYKISIYNMQGELLNNEILQEKKKAITLDLSEYNSGFYLVRIITTENTIISEKALKI